MKLFVGLGNPGDTYKNTRHNVGCLLLEKLCETENFTHVLYQKKFSATTCTGLIHKWQVIAGFPQTYMNKSGQSVHAIMQYYKLHTDDLLVFQDDIDLPFGKIKLKYGGSHGGHNGIRDIVQKIGTQNFRRLKIGVGRPAHPDHSVSDYVLHNFSSQELKDMYDSLYTIRERVDAYLKNTG